MADNTHEKDQLTFTEKLQQKAPGYEGNGPVPPPLVKKELLGAYHCRQAVEILNDTVDTDKRIKDNTLLRPFLQGAIEKHSSHALHVLEETPDALLTPSEIRFRQLLQYQLRHKIQGLDRIEGSPPLQQWLKI